MTKSDSDLHLLKEYHRNFQEMCDQMAWVCMLILLLSGYPTSCALLPQQDLSIDNLARVVKIQISIHIRRDLIETLIGTATVIACDHGGTPSAIGGALIAAAVLSAEHSKQWTKDAGRGRHNRQGQGDIDWEQGSTPNRSGGWDGGHTTKKNALLTSPYSLEEYKDVKKTICNAISTMEDELKKFFTLQCWMDVNSDPKEILNRYKTTLPQLPSSAAQKANDAAMSLYQVYKITVTRATEHIIPDTLLQTILDWMLPWATTSQSLKAYK
uniref:Uncharacterized protein n=1 Tax=Romanomermis culicivorax TaxID=13658 RepID=A0A915IWS4_ROMCU